ncbi:uncharacterized protein BT62DRAFT_984448 [Guyanagaster necrorhizus]|uniref:SUN domain-containing protein n=1 Tax=Guyanagaster necrorhizus TaxID=856835 RepID=A0A9P8AX10_9AGAR|nr:uncharacterized protein BT62DRAFT_984448 [Guyanagaster necrorhizus MCA 3950]KAG7451264.1 hypothetical protein BT62DRAFT_984448 [Guyanagaster necrorhizus MCA 3950]
MSFAGTPLGQGRRLDHSTFLGKPASNGNRPPSPQRLVPTSFTYGAPLLGPRSPSKPTSSRERRAVTDHDDGEAPALTRPGGPQLYTSPPHSPEKWSVKDTSVNIATAFTQAAYNMQAGNPNNSWASSRPITSYHRGTSAEYEQISRATGQRRLAAPPNRFNNPPNRPPSRAPNTLSKAPSLQQVPDSEGEENTGARARSPLAELASKTLANASFYLRRPSHEPEDLSVEQPSANGKNNSYDYSAEERDFQNQQQTAPRRKTILRRGGGMSSDNKAYKPTQSDMEESDEEFVDDDNRKRKPKKKDAGRLTTLPTIGETKRRKKKAKPSKGAAAAEESEEGEEEEEEEQSARASQTRESAPSLRRSASHHPQPSDAQLISEDALLNAEQGLTSIPERDECPPDRDPPRRLSIGALLGSLINYSCHGIMNLAIWSWGFVVTAFFFCGKVFGTFMGVALLVPLQWILKGSSSVFMRYLVVGLAIMGGWYVLQEPILRFTPRFPSGPLYTPPETPASSMAELNARLHQIEASLAGLALESERTKTKVDNDARSRIDVVGRLSSLESRVQKENFRVLEAEVQHRDMINGAVQAVKKEMEVLQVQMQTQGSSKPEGPVSDEEARARLKALEERVGTVGGGVREAAKAGAAVASMSWWNNGKKGLTIKSSDGQDVTKLVEQLDKDTIAKPDFALHSGGARIIPSLTSPTFEIRPRTLRGQVFGTITGDGYAIGRPPITALHHESHNGHCWPFAGSSGQLAVVLAAPAYIKEISIDHVAKEVAFDMRSAPRRMEVWGLVEGRENIVKVGEWKAEKARLRAEALGRGEIVEEEEYPKTLPKLPMYVRIAAFDYNIYAPNHVQTFPVLDEIQDLGVDFGIVVLRILSNWGRDEFTCLYRFRVHGERLGGVPPPYPEEVLLES